MLQMIIAFMTPDYLTLILVIAYYVVNCVSSDNINELDSKILDRLWRKGRPERPRLKNTLEQMILVYSDTQAVTGLAVLVAGHSQLHCGGISVYHWQIMIFTAWFSSLTHVATLIALRTCFRTKSPRARAVRVVLMFATLALLVACPRTACRGAVGMARKVRRRLRGKEQSTSGSNYVYILARSLLYNKATLSSLIS